MKHLSRSIFVVRGLGISKALDAWSHSIHSLVALYQPTSPLQMPRHHAYPPMALLLLHPMAAYPQDPQRYVPQAHQAVDQKDLHFSIMPRCIPPEVLGNTALNDHHHSPYLKVLLS